MNPRVPEAVAKTELDSLAKTYGKFWCTWQVDRGKSINPSLILAINMHVDILDCSIEFVLRG